jgi:hypothetical protein
VPKEQGIQEMSGAKDIWKEILAFLYRDTTDEQLKDILYRTP